MSGRASNAVTLAVRMVRTKGCTPAEAAKKHQCAVTSVRRMMARMGEPTHRPVGRPRKEAP